MTEGTRSQKGQSPESRRESQDKDTFEAECRVTENLLPLISVT